MANFLCVFGRNLKLIATGLGWWGNYEIFLLTPEVYAQPWLAGQKDFQNFYLLQLCNIAGLLDRPAGCTSWMDLFSLFEALASLHIQRLRFQSVHCCSFWVRWKPCSIISITTRFKEIKKCNKRLGFPFPWQPVGKIIKIPTQLQLTSTST